MTSFYIKRWSNGTFSNLTVTGLTTGVAHVDSNGVFSSSAVDLASADVTGLLPEANFAVRAGVITSGSSTPVCLVGNRATLQSPVDNAKSGAVNMGSRSTGATAGASNDYATICGGDQQTASGQYATVCGGILNVASAGVSFIGGGNSNTASGTYAAICGGLNNVGSATNATVPGGESNTANTGTHSSALGGKSNNASGQYATTIGGLSNAASGKYATACGTLAVAAKSGQHSHASTAFSSVAGSAQWTRVVYIATSTDNASANCVDDAGDEYALSANTDYLLRVSVVSAEAAGASASAWTWDVLVSVIADGTATIVDQVNSYTKTSANYTIPTISIASNKLRVAVTGKPASSVVRSVCTIEATELKFA